MDKLSRIINTVLSETVDSSNIILEEFNFEDNLDNIVRVARNHIKKKAIDIMEDGMIEGIIDENIGKVVVKAIIENDGVIKKFVNTGPRYVMVENDKLFGLQKIDNILSESIPDHDKVSKIRDLVYSGRLCEDRFDVIMEGEDEAIPTVGGTFLPISQEEEKEEVLGDYEKLLKKPLGHIAQLAINKGKKIDALHILGLDLPEHKKKHELISLLGYEPMQRNEVNPNKIDTDEVSKLAKKELDDKFAIPSSSRKDKEVKKDMRKTTSAEGILSKENFNLRNYPIIGRDNNGSYVAFKLNKFMKSTELRRKFNKLFDKFGGHLIYKGYNALVGPNGIYGQGTPEYHEYVIDTKNYKLAVLMKSVLHPGDKPGEKDKYYSIDTMLSIVSSSQFSTFLVNILLLFTSFSIGISSDVSILSLLTCFSNFLMPVGERKSDLF
jgi:hypothetical protein